MSLSLTACGAWQGHPLGGGRRFPCRLSATTPAGRESLLTEKGSEPCLAHAPGGRRGPVPRALVSGWCAVLAVVPLRSPSPGAVCRTPACHECEPLAVRTPACGFEWRAIPLAGWLSGFELSHIGCRGVPRGRCFVFFYLPPAAQGGSRGGRIVTARECERGLAAGC